MQLEVGERLDLGGLPALSGNVLDGEHVVREGGAEEERTIGQGRRGRRLGDSEEGRLNTEAGGREGAVRRECEVLVRPGLGLRIQDEEGGLR